MSLTRQSISTALRQASRARHSLRAGITAAKAAGEEWEWLANSLTDVADRLEKILTVGRKSRPRR